MKLHFSTVLLLFNFGFKKKLECVFIDNEAFEVLKTVLKLNFICSFRHYFVLWSTKTMLIWNFILNILSDRTFSSAFNCFSLILISLIAQNFRFLIRKCTKKTSSCNSEANYKCCGTLKMRIGKGSCRDIYFKVDPTLDSCRSSSRIYSYIAVH